MRSAEKVADAIAHGVTPRFLRDDWQTGDKRVDGIISGYRNLVLNYPTDQGLLMSCTEGAEPLYKMARNRKWSRRFMIALWTFVVLLWIVPLIKKLL